MNKKSVILFILFVAITSVYMYFYDTVYDFVRDLYNQNINNTDYLYGEAVGEKGKISLKIRVDNSKTIKEVIVLEHSDSDIAINALQKLITNSLDKQYYSEIDTVSGATDTSSTYISIIKDLLGEPIEYVDETKEERVSIDDPDLGIALDRIVVNPGGLKSGIGGYVYNRFQDADYDHNGVLSTNEYICAVLLDEENNIIDVTFDHIPSNINFDMYGSVPTGGAKAYTFISDKSKIDFNGIINDGNSIDVYAFEKQIIDLKNMKSINYAYGNIKAYAPYLEALSNAIDNSRFIGADYGDRLGVSVSKILKKRDIKDATSTSDGKVDFTSSYCMITSDKDGKISSCMFDNVANRVVLTNTGQILGSREKEIFTLNELSDTSKYTRIDLSKFNLKLEYNVLGDYIRGKTVDDMLSYISLYTDDRGMALDEYSFRDLKDIDFVEIIDLLSKAYIDSIAIVAK